LHSGLAPRQHEPQHQAETAGSGEEGSALACWQPWQLHVGPQLQTSPHWHDTGRAAAFWQPHVHSEPVQVAQTQTFD
jgi:hypothetical protein